MDEQLIIHLIRDGEPVGKARVRKAPISKGGQWYTPQKTEDAEEEWQWLFLEKGYKSFPANVPLSVTVVAYMKDPMKKFDVDNLAKLCLDALEGFAYPNDKQIVHLLARKMQGEPRTEVWITNLKEVR